jgi:hypothetical protein
VDGILGHNLLLSRTFFHNLAFFSRWNSGYQEAFFTSFSFFHDGILAIQKPFSRTFLFFTMEFWLSRSLFHELFFFHGGILAIKKPFFTNFSFFHDGILAIKKPFSRTFHFSRWNSANTQFGGRLFSYIYHKEYLHRICLVKNLAS